MKGIFILVLAFFIIGGVSSQTGEVINDTIYVQFKETRPVEFSKAVGKVLYIRGIVPEDIPEKSRSFQMISSVANEIDPDSIIVVNKTDLTIPVSVFQDKYYTLYIKKGNASITNKRIIVR